MRLTALLALPVLAAGTLTVAPAAAHDEAPAPGERRTITVAGTGEASGAPDLATLRFSVVTRADAASEAMAANAEAATAVRDRLRRLGVEARDMQTSGLSLGPYYEQGEGRRYDESRIVGYEARNGLMVRLRDLDQAGAVIDAAVAAGANGLDGLSFAIEEADALAEAAKQEAVADARANAELLTEAAGVSLGRVLSISEQGHGAPHPVMMEARMMADGASTPIEGGEQTVSATVQVVYALE